MVVEELLGLSGPIHHFVIDAGDVEHQAHHQTEAWTENIEGDSESRNQMGQTGRSASRPLRRKPDSCAINTQGDGMQRDRANQLYSTFLCQHLSRGEGS